MNRHMTQPGVNFVAPGLEPTPAPALQALEISVGPTHIINEVVVVTARFYIGKVVHHPVSPHYRLDLSPMMVMVEVKKCTLRLISSLKHKHNTINNTDSRAAFEI